MGKQLKKMKQDTNKIDAKVYSVANYIASLDTVPMCTPDETFGSALSLVKNSHTGVYVVDKTGMFKGIVVPYQARFQHHFPYFKRVASDLMVPPVITESTPLYEVAEYMLSTRVYNLPVFSEDGKLLGPVHAKDILLGISQDREFLDYVSRLISVSDPITAPDDATIEEVYHVLRNKEISRGILVDDKNKVVGIVTRSDILRAFIHPTEKQRFSKKLGDSGYFAFDEEKTYRKDDPVKKYATDFVESISDSKTMSTKIQKLIFSKYNSIVVVDSDNRPVGFLSLRDILEAVSTLRPVEESTPIIMEKPSATVSKNEYLQFQEMIERMRSKVQKRIKLEKIEVSFEEPKYPDGKTAEFNTTIVVTPLKGEKLVAKTKNPVFLNAVSQAISEITRQEEKRVIRRFAYQDRYTSV